MECRVRNVSPEGRGSSRALSAYVFPSRDLLRLLLLKKVNSCMSPRVVAFLVLRHSEMLSAELLTLFHSTRRWTGELLSSLSSTVLRQSSMASLTAVTNRMTIKGTEPKPGLEAPNMLKNCSTGRISIVSCSGVQHVPYS